MTSKHVARGTFWTSALLLACAGAVPSAALERETDPVILGTFDSRAVAIAYVNSDRFRTTMEGLHQELASAQASGNETRVAELEAYGPELQQRLHRQGFSTGSVADILKHIEDQLPALARRASVDVIVSKWDLVYQAPEVAPIDVTDLLVAALKPDEQGLKSAREIVTKAPVPRDDLTHDH